MERGRRELKRPLWSRLALPIAAVAVAIVLLAVRPGRRSGTEVRAGTAGTRDPSVPEISIAPPSDGAASGTDGDADGGVSDGTVLSAGAGSDGIAGTVSDGLVPSEGDGAGLMDGAGSDGTAGTPDDDGPADETGATGEAGETRADPPPGEEPEEDQEDQDAVPPRPVSYDDASSLPLRLRLSTTDFTVRELGQDTRLRVSGGSGTYIWISEDPSIARVEQDGTVTSISGGTTHVAVTDGSSSAVCIVRVRTASGQSAPSGQYQLNRTDFTIHVGDDPFRLQLSGGDAPGLLWDSSDPGVAKVDQNGLVVPVGPGTATVTASWEGRSLTCIVRVPQD